MIEDIQFGVKVLGTVKQQNCIVSMAYLSLVWFRGSAVERRSLAGELSLSCA